MSEADVTFAAGSGAALLKRSGTRVSMLGRLGRFLGIGGKRQPTEGHGPQRLSARSHEAAESGRLNEAHWLKAADQSINLWLVDELSTLRARAALEAKNNPAVDGVIETHVTDVVGKDGPTLQMQSSSREFNELIENDWRRWWAWPEITGLWTGPEVLAYDLRCLWKAGDWFKQLVTGQTATGPELRIRLIEPRRIASPAIISTDTVLGIKRDGNGRPLAYYVESVGPYFNLTLKTVEVPARDMRHGFWAAEADQVRGFPWLSAALPAIADLRDYDMQVLDAARAAADFSILLVCRDPRAEPLQSFGDSVTIRRRQMTDLPPGYEGQGFTPPQPSTQYKDYRAERQRDIGRGQCMPLTKVRCDATPANFSSARLDITAYGGRVALIQGWLGRKDLDPLLALRILDVVRARGMALPDDWDQHQWTWPKLPPADPLKEAQAASERLKNRTSCIRDETDGNWEELMEQRAREESRERELREEYGLPEPSTKTAANGPADAAGDGDGEPNPDGNGNGRIFSGILAGRN